MKYYRVKPKYDNFEYSLDFDFLCRYELLTEKEMLKHCDKYALKVHHRYGDNVPYARIYNNFINMFDVVNVSKRDIYFCFGFRFEKDKARPMSL